MPKFYITLSIKMLLALEILLVQYLADSDSNQMITQYTDNENIYSINSYFSEPDECTIKKEMECNEEQCYYASSECEHPKFFLIRHVELDANTEYFFQRQIGPDTFMHPKHKTDLTFIPDEMCNLSKLCFNSKIYSVYNLEKIDEKAFAVSEGKVADLEAIFGYNYSVEHNLPEFSIESFHKAMELVEAQGFAVLWSLDILILSTDNDSTAVSTFRNSYVERMDGNGLSLDLKAGMARIAFTKIDGESDTAEMAVIKPEENKRVLIVSISVSCAIFLIVCLIAAICLTRNVRQEMGVLQMENPNLDAGQMGQVRVPYAFAVEEEM